jgi:hypothetical protein
MKRLFAFAFSLSVALFAANNESRTFAGIITDTMCGADHAHMGISPDAKCVRECVRMDPKKWKYALHDGKKMYVLSDQQTPERFAAQRVRVTGVLYEKTGIIRVDKIEALSGDGSSDGGKSSHAGHAH